MTAEMAFAIVSFVVSVVLLLVLHRLNDRYWSLRDRLDDVRNEVMGSRRRIEALEASGKQRN